MKINILFLLCFLHFYSCSANILSDLYKRHLAQLFTFGKNNYRIDKSSHPEIENTQGNFNIDLIPKNAIYSATVYADDDFRLINFLQNRALYKKNPLQFGGIHRSFGNFAIHYSRNPETAPQLHFSGANFSQGNSTTILQYYNIYPLPNPPQNTTYLIDCSSIIGKAQNNFLEITILARPRILPPAPITPQTEDPKNPIMQNNTVDLGKISHKYLLTLKPGSSFSFTIPHNQHSSGCEGNNTFSFGVDNHGNPHSITIAEMPSHPIRTYHVMIPSSITQKSSYSIALKRDSLFTDNHGCSKENQATLGILEIVITP